MELFGDKVINKMAIQDLTDEEADKLMELLSEAGY